MIFRGSGPVSLEDPVFVILRGGSPLDPCMLSHNAQSANATWFNKQGIVWAVRMYVDNPLVKVRQGLSSQEDVQTIQ